MTGVTACLAEELETQALRLEAKAFRDLACFDDLYGADADFVLPDSSRSRTTFSLFEPDAFGCQSNNYFLDEGLDQLDAFAATMPAAPISMAKNSVLPLINLEAPRAWQGCTMSPWCDLQDSHVGRCTRTASVPGLAAYSCERSNEVDASGVTKYSDGDLTNQADGEQSGAGSGKHDTGADEHEDSSPWKAAVPVPSDPGLAGEEHVSMRGPMEVPPPVPLFNGMGQRSASVDSGLGPMHPSQGHAPHERTHLPHGRLVGSFLAPGVSQVQAGWQQQQHGAITSPRRSVSMPAAQPVYTSAFVAATAAHLAAPPVYGSAVVAGAPSVWPFGSSNHELPQQPRLKMARSTPNFCARQAAVRPDGAPLSPAPKRSGSLASSLQGMDPHGAAHGVAPLYHNLQTAQGCMSPTSGMSSGMTMDPNLMGLVDGGMTCMAPAPHMPQQLGQRLPADATQPSLTKVERRRAATVPGAAAGGAVARGKKRAAPVSGMTISKPAPNPNGHSCTQCGTQTTPVWRAGPHGPKTLCNACGVRYMKVAKKK